MSGSFLVASAVLVIVSTLGLAVGAMYVGGGSAAVRRQLPRLGLLALLVVAVAVVTPLLIENLGTPLVILLLMLNTAVVMMWLRQRQTGQGPLVRERRRIAWQMPGFRWLVIAYVSVVTFGAVALAIGFRSAQ